VELTLRAPARYCGSGFKGRGPPAESSWARSWWPNPDRSPKRAGRWPWITTPLRLKRALEPGPISSQGQFLYALRHRSSHRFRGSSAGIVMPTGQEGRPWSARASSTPRIEPGWRVWPGRVQTFPSRDPESETMVIGGEPVQKETMEVRSMGALFRQGLKAYEVLDYTLACPCKTVVSPPGRGGADR